MPPARDCMNPEEIERDGRRVQDETQRGLMLIAEERKGFRSCSGSCMQLLLRAAGKVFCLKTSLNSGSIGLQKKLFLPDSKSLSVSLNFDTLAIH